MQNDWYLVKRLLSPAHTVKSTDFANACAGSVDVEAAPYGWGPTGERIEPPMRAGYCLGEELLR